MGHQSSLATHSKHLSIYIFSWQLLVLTLASLQLPLLVPIVAGVALDVIGQQVVFAMVPGSSINSWDSWFIFNLQKINTCYTRTICTRKKGQQLTVWGVHICTVTAYILNIFFSASMLVSGLRTSLYNNAHISNNIHTWASVLLRHLASTSFMGPFWAYTDSSSVPISGSPSQKPRLSGRGCLQS